MQLPRNYLVAVVALLLPISGLVDAAPPKLSYLFPSGAARGDAVQVTAGGSFSSWPVKAWVDRQGIQIEANKTKGRLDVVVAPDALPGTYWIRLYDSQGASSLRPFLVGTLPEVLEQEPNDKLQQLQQVSDRSVVNGVLSKRGDVDAYVVELSKGQTLVASLEGNCCLGSPMDAVLQICTPDGFILKQNDDERGLDPLLVYSPSNDGMYVVRVFAFPETPNSTIGFAGASNYVYRLTVTTGAFIDHAMPMSLDARAETDLQLMGWNLTGETCHLRVVSDPKDSSKDVCQFQAAGAVNLPISLLKQVVSEPSNTPSRPQWVDLPVVISGRIDAAADIDTFQFRARKGQRLSLQVESRSIGFPLDAVLQLADAKGKVLAEVDDPLRQPDPLIIHTMPADGEYRVSIRDVHGFGGFRYVYRIVIQDVAPDFALSLPSGSFVLKPGQPLKIPVTIDRRHSFAAEISISAEQLPRGVVASTVKSIAKGKSAKRVELTLEAHSKRAASASIQIVGCTESDGGRTRKTASFDEVGQKHDNVWLTVLP